jgi:type VI secretion system protein ImpC
MPASTKRPFNLSLNMNTHNTDTGKEAQEIRDRPFYIAMMGDFSATQHSADKADIGERSFIEIDRYNHDEVLACMDLKLSLDLVSGVTVEVAIQTLKDFHPDNLYKNVTLFARLRDLRKRLDNPATFQQAMLELGIQPTNKDSSRQAGSVTAEQPQPQTPMDLSGARLLDSVINESDHRFEPGSMVPTSAQARIDDFIRQIVAKSERALSRDARQDEQVAWVDDAISQQMRLLLHHPRFQAVEAAWRAVHFMVKRIGSGKKIKLYLLDVSRERLESELTVDDVTATRLYRTFCDHQMGDIDWSLIIGDYRFGADIDDMLLLSQLGMIVQQSGAQFIAAADETLVGCTSFAEKPKTDHWQNEVSPSVDEAWALLRKSPVAKSISLALPRFLLRTPYGKQSTKIKTFTFEEMSARPEHNHYLWGNPAFVKGEQIARAFTESGWNMQLANVLNTEDLPIHYYNEGGHTRVKPCAEIPLTDTGAGKMIARGLIPLWSVKESDRVHSGDFHSIAY